MSTKTCPTCHRQLDASATTCPGCGRSFTNSRLIGLVVAMILLALLFLFLPAINDALF